MFVPQYSHHGALIRSRAFDDVDPGVEVLAERGARHEPTRQARRLAPELEGVASDGIELGEDQLAFLMFVEPTRELMRRMTARRSFSGRAMTC